MDFVQKVIDSTLENKEKDNELQVQTADRYVTQNKEERKLKYYKL